MNHLIKLIIIMIVPLILLLMFWLWQNQITDCVFRLSLFIYYQILFESIANYTFEQTDSKLCNMFEKPKWKSNKTTKENWSEASRQQNVKTRGRQRASKQNENTV